LTNIKRASELDPLDNNFALTLGGTYAAMGRYADANDCYERSIELVPGYAAPYVMQAKLYLVWKGSTAEARKVLERAEEFPLFRIDDQFVLLRFGLDVLDKKYEEALAQLPLTLKTTDTSNISEKTADTSNISDNLEHALIYEGMKDTTSARIYYKQTVQLLQARLEDKPNHAWAHSMLGIAYAGLGQSEIAIKEGKQGVKLGLETLGPRDNFAATRDLAEIYTMVGQYDNAIDLIIEDLLSFPKNMSIPLLRIDPTWDPLRDHPRFQELLESEN
jgi:serine/threonine-protein kinase